MPTYTEKTNELTDGFIGHYIERINDDGTIDSIPKEPTNSDYQAYLASLKSDGE